MHRHPERGNPYVFLHGSFQGFTAVFLGGGAPRLNHLEPDQQQDQPARDFKSRQRDPEHAEDQPARDGEHRQHSETCPGGALRHTASSLGFMVRGHRQECRNGGEWIDEEEDRTQCHK
jgi:hypothetical protein